MSRKHRISCQVAIVIDLLFVMPFVMTVGAFAQSPSDSDRARKAALGMLHSRDIRDIPEATLPCTAEEAKWWQGVREAAKAVQDTRGGKKEKEEFLGLLPEGQEKDRKFVPFRLPVTMSFNIY